MHIGRSRVEIIWSYTGIIPAINVVTMTIGGPGTGFNCGPGADIAPVTDIPYFAVDVYTDVACQVNILTGLTAASLDVMATLTCAAALQHNTIYDMPPPWNKDGYLILCTHWLQIIAANPTGTDTSTFVLVARAWK